MTSNPDRQQPSKDIPKKSTIFEKAMAAGLFANTDGMGDKEREEFFEARRILQHVSKLMENPLCWKMVNGKFEFRIDNSAELLEDIASSPGKGLTDQQSDTIIAIMKMHGITTDKHGVGNELGSFHARDKYRMNYTIEKVQNSSPDERYLEAFKALPDRFKNEVLERLKGKIE